MLQTATAILPLLQFIAIPTVAAKLTSTSIDKLRAVFPVERAIGRPFFVRWLLMLIHSPRLTRYTAIVASLLLTVVCTAAAAALGGRDVIVAVDDVLAGALAALATQFIHAQSKPLALPEGLVVDVSFDVDDVGVIEHEREIDRIIAKMERNEPLTESEAATIFPHIREINEERDA